MARSSRRPIAASFLFTRRSPSLIDDQHFVSDLEVVEVAVHPAEGDLQDAVEDIEWWPRAEEPVAPRMLGPRAD